MGRVKASPPQVPASDQHQMDRLVFKVQILELLVSNNKKINLFKLELDLPPEEKLSKIKTRRFD